MSKIDILLVDDHRLFLDGLKAVLKSSDITGSITICTEAVDALDFLTTNKVDLILSDVSMPLLNGIEFTLKAKDIAPNIKVILFSMFPPTNIPEHIDGYLIKGVSNDEIIETIKLVSIENGKQSRLSNHSTQKNVKSGLLSSREIDITKLVAEELTVDQIANKLILSRHTIETHKKNIFHKLGVKNIAGLVKKAIYLGYIK